MKHKVTVISLSTETLKRKDVVTWLFAAALRVHLWHFTFKSSQTISHSWIFMLLFYPFWQQDILIILWLMHFDSSSQWQKLMPPTQIYGHKCVAGVTLFWQIWHMSDLSVFTRWEWVGGLLCSVPSDKISKRKPGWLPLLVTTKALFLWYPCRPAINATQESGLGGNLRVEPACWVVGL